MNRSSVSAVHDQIFGPLGAAPDAPAFLTDPDFFLTGFGDVTLTSAGPSIALFPGYENNSSNGYDNVQLEIIGLTIADTLNSPENIGSIGAANAGFFQTIGIAPNSMSGVETVTLRMTGIRGGTTDVYGDEVTIQVTVNGV